MPRSVREYKYFSCLARCDSVDSRWEGVQGNVVGWVRSGCVEGVEWLSGLFVARPSYVLVECLPPKWLTNLVEPVLVCIQCF